jgi:hypothetical protein
MKMLNNVVPALILPLFSPALVADTEFGDSVPREVVMQFVGGNPLAGIQGRLYSDILEAFPPFAMPDGFAVLASADQDRLQRVILRTELDGTEARDAITAALMDAGWSVIPDQGMRNQTGFVTASQQQPLYVQFCHDDLGNINVSVAPGEAVRYVNLNRYASGVLGNQASCQQQRDPSFQQFGPRGFGPQLMQYAPRLVMPQPDTSANGPQRIVDAVSVGGGNSGNMNDWESRGTLRIDWSLDEIAQHFVEQIEDQGWMPDSEVTGAVVASGSWTKTVDDMELTGILTIVEQAENTWDLKFRVMRRVNTQ